MLYLPLHLRTKSVDDIEPAVATGKTSVHATCSIWLAAFLENLRVPLTQ